jgi:hypothetical protein
MITTAKAERTTTDFNDLLPPIAAGFSLILLPFSSPDKAEPVSGASTQTVEDART